MSNMVTLLDQIASQQAAKEVIANMLFDAASPAMIWGRHGSACNGLTWGYYGGTYMVGSTANAIANGTVALTANTTNYVYASAATGGVSANTTGFPAGSIPLYSIVTGTMTVTNYTDVRSYQPSAVAGGVTSVGISMPGIYSVTGSPVTSSGTLTVTLNTQAPNAVWAGPTSGAAAAPTFRALVGADIPAFGGSGASHSQGGVPDPGATAGTIKFLREDGTWSIPAGATGSGSITSGTNVGSGAGQVYDSTDTTATTLAFKTIKAGANITVTNNAQDITIAATGGSSKDQFSYYLANNPTDAPFTLVQNTGVGGAAVMANLPSARGFSLLVPNTSSSDNIALAQQNTPGSSSWSIKVLISCLAPINAASDFGLFVGDATGKLQTFVLDQFSLAVRSDMWNTINSFNARGAGFPYGNISPYSVWMKLNYTSGGNFVLYLSIDGETWVQTVSVGVTSFIGAPTVCGLILNNNPNNSSPVAQAAITCFHYSQG
jgi:hypothetical protein